jgi:hypothetical protein
MRLSVIGCGHLGAVHAACMADIGHEVLGVDIDESKTEMLNSGKAWFSEPGLDEMLSRNVRGQAQIHYELRRGREVRGPESASAMVLACGDDTHTAKWRDNEAPVRDGNEIQHLTSYQGLRCHFGPAAPAYPHLDHLVVNSSPTPIKPGSSRHTLVTPGSLAILTVSDGERVDASQ